MKSALISILLVVLVIGGVLYVKTHGIPSFRGPYTGVETSSSTRVDLSGRGVIEVPRNIFEMTHVRELDLSSNELTGALPAEIRNLKELEILDVHNNHMTGLPAELGQLSKLRILNVSHNNLTGLPHELGNLKNLQVLDLSDNAISPYDLEIIRKALPTSVHIVQ